MISKLNKEIKTINYSFSLFFENYVVLGRFSGAYGILGWIKVISFTEQRNNIISYQPWLVNLGHAWDFIYIEQWYFCRNNLIVKIKDINDRETAFSLRNKEINIHRFQLPELKDNEYYWNDLVGCDVYTIFGINLGKIIYLIETGSNDVLVVRGRNVMNFDIQEFLIPFIEGDIVRSVDIFNKIILIDWSILI